MGLSENYHWLLDEASDQRVKDWFMMDTPLWPIGLAASYLYFVLVCGPRYMKNRPAYSLKKFIICYNIYQVVACSAFLWGIATNGWTTTYSFGCQGIDYSDKPEAIQMLKWVYWLVFLKMSEFTETIVFVLRKKDKQISFLHLYHHVSTFMLAWVGAKFVGGGMATFPIMPNSFVHIVMYTYYLLSLSKNPKLQKILQKFKPYITIMQMVQFAIIVLHAMQVFYPDCNLPRTLAYFYIPNVLLIFYLFYDFYKGTYTKTPKKAASGKAS